MCRRESQELGDSLQWVSEVRIYSLKLIHESWTYLFFHKLSLLLNQLCSSLAVSRCCCDLLLCQPSQPCTVCLPTIVSCTPSAITARYSEERMIGKEVSTHPQLILLIIMMQIIITLFYIPFVNLRMLYVQSI